MLLTVQAVWILETAFCTFFAMETFLKIFGLRQHYFTLPWNTYDFIVAVVSVVGQHHTPCVCTAWSTTALDYFSSTIVWAQYGYPKQFVCTMYVFRYLFHPPVTAVVCKRSWSFCQKCRWQVTAKHTYTLPVWFCMKWHGAWLCGVHRTCQDSCSFMWHQPCHHLK